MQWQKLRKILTVNLFNRDNSEGVPNKYGFKKPWLLLNVIPLKGS